MAGKYFKTCAISVMVAGLTVTTTQDVQAAVTYRSVALAGEVAPGAGATFSSFSFRPPAINGAGQVAFHGSLIGPGMTFTDPSIWVGVPGSLALAARRGESAPGTGVSFAGFFDASPVLNSAGQVAFGGFLNGQGVDFTNNTGIWAGTPGSLVLVARKGGAAPGAAPGAGAGATFRSDTGRPLLNGAGQVAFRSFLAGPGVGLSNNQGIWVGAPGSLALAVRLGDAAAGTGVGVNFKSFNAFRLNDAGQIALASDLIGVGVDSTNNEGIWVGLPGSLTLAAREGNAAPGAGAGVHFGSFLFNAPSLNGSGQLAFLGSLIGPGVDSSNGSGIWTGVPGSLSLVVRDGEAVPGVGGGVHFGSFDRPVLNGAGQVAFEGFLGGPGVNSTNNRGIWVGTRGSLALTARLGDPAPGTGTGVKFGILPSVPPVLNGVGQVVFPGFLVGPGVDSTNSKGIWATDPNGILSLIVRAGDLFDVNDDPLIEDLRRISMVDLVTGSGGEDGNFTALNDAGQITFMLRFTDRSSGIFIATIPEPGTVGLVAVGWLLILRRRRRG